MGILLDLLNGVVSRPGIKVIDNKSVTFESYDAMRHNSDVVRDIVPDKKNQTGPTNFANWGTDENGQPVYIDYPEGN